MGVVYTPEQLRDGKVPEPGAQQRAGRFVLEHFESFIDDDPALQSGMIYGSTVTQPTRRSDLDILTVFDSDSVTPHSLDRLRALYRVAENHFHVHTESNVLLLNDRSNPADHQLDTLIGIGLVQSSEEFPQWLVGKPIGNLPLEELTQEKALLVAQNHAAHKERRFLKSLVHPAESPMDYKALQRALELPSTLGRKAICALEYSPGQPPFIPNREWSLEIAETLLSKNDQNAVGLTAHRELASRDMEYSSLLEGVVGGNTPLLRYERWFGQNYRHILHSARTLATAWKNTLSTRRRQ